MASLDADGLNREFVAYVYSYLENREQCVTINGAGSYPISGVPQGSILAPTLCDSFFNNVFLICYKWRVIFVGDNTLAFF